MKLTVPVRDLKEIDFAHKLWIQDLYAWFIDQDFEKNEKWTWIYNWRITSNGNFPDIDSIIYAVKYCKDRNITLNLTFNILPFVWDEVLLKLALKNIQKIKAHNIIIADINIMKYFKSDKIIISTLSSLYNSLSIQFFLNRYPNINRLVLPRELSIPEKQSIMDDKQTSFEILILNDWCYNSNAMCSSLHFWDIVKKVKYSCRRDDQYYSTHSDMDTKNLQKITGKRNDCKVCSMYFYKKYPDVYFKIAGRVKNTIALKKDMLFSKKILDRLQLNESYKEFISQNIYLHQKIYGKKCDYNNCEYFKSKEVN